MLIRILMAATMMPTAAPLRDAQDLIPLELLAQGPELSTVKVAPDKRQLAVVAMRDGRRSIMLDDMDGGNRRLLYRNPLRSIGDVHWSGDGRWLYTFQDAGGDEGYHLFRIDLQRPGSATDLTPFAGSRVEAIRTPSPPPRVVPITLDRRDREWPDAYSLDLATGKLTEQVRNTIGATEFFADEKGLVRAATAIRIDGRLELLRKNPAGRWSVLYIAPIFERFSVVTLAPGGRSVIVRTNRDRAAEQLLEIELATGRQKPVLDGTCGRFDVGGIQYRSDGKVAAITCVLERADLKGGDPFFRRVINDIRKVAGTETGLSLESVSTDGRAAVLFADASDSPGRFLLWLEGRVREVGRTHPGLVGQPLARSEHRWLTARDGLPLLAYVTRPRGANGPMPMVVAIHGGPWSRDTGGFESESQLLANRGYVVLQVNFRGSTGLGKATFEGGVGEFGRKMSDDIDDAVDWAVSQGIARGDRICLLGGSYGGYAALMGLVREPGRYRCGVSYAGPVDLVTLVESFPPGWGPFLPRSWHRFVGNPQLPGVKKELANRSPLTMAERIIAPLLIFQGANDPRVTQSQSDSMVCTMRRRGVAVEYLLSPSEGHSFANEETSLAVNRAVELFFAKHLGGRASKPPPARVEAALGSLRSSGNATRCPKM